jgi:hypothetical protein
VKTRDNGEIENLMGNFKKYKTVYTFSVKSGIKNDSEELESGREQ